MINNSDDISQTDRKNIFYSTNFSFNLPNKNTSNANNVSTLLEDLKNAESNSQIKLANFKISLDDNISEKLLDNLQFTTEKGKSLQKYRFVNEAYIDEFIRKRNKMLDTSELQRVEKISQKNPSLDLGLNKKRQIYNYITQQIEKKALKQKALQSFEDLFDDEEKQELFEKNYPLKDVQQYYIELTKGITLCYASARFAFLCLLKYIEAPNEDNLLLECYFRLILLFLYHIVENKENSNFTEEEINFIEVLRCSRVGHTRHKFLIEGVPEFELQNAFITKDKKDQVFTVYQGGCFYEYDINSLIVSQLLLLINKAMKHFGELLPKVPTCFDNDVAKVANNLEGYIVNLSEEVDLSKYLSNMSLVRKFNTIDTTLSEEQIRIYIIRKEFKLAQFALHKYREGCKDEEYKDAFLLFMEAIICTSVCNGWDIYKNHYNDLMLDEQLLRKVEKLRDELFAHFYKIPNRILVVGEDFQYAENEGVEKGVRLDLDENSQHRDKIDEMLEQLISSCDTKLGKNSKLDIPISRFAFN